MGRSLRRSRRSVRKGNSDYNEGDIVEVRFVENTNAAAVNVI
jgi:hypothetical protein